MKTMLAAMFAVILSTIGAMADHTYSVVALRGIAEDDSGTFRVTEMSLVGGGNFLVAYYDAIPSTEDFFLEEWADTNADGVPDLFIGGLFSATHQASLDNGKFACNLTDDANGEAALSLSGKVKIKDGDQQGLKAKVQGVWSDEDEGPNDDTIFKGNLKSRGKPF